MEANQRQIFLVLMGVRNLKVREKEGVANGGCEKEGLEGKQHGKKKYIECRLSELGDLRG